MSPGGDRVRVAVRDAGFPLVVSSELGKGSQFALDLPLAAAQQAPEPDPVAAPRPVVRQRPPARRRRPVG